MTKEEALKIAAKLKERLLEHHVPVRQMLLYGSAARGTATPDSDIDIAVVCTPFRPSRLEENIEVSKQRWDLDLRIETVCLHPEDMEDPYFYLARSVQKEGIPV